MTFQLSDQVLISSELELTLKAKQFTENDCLITRGKLIIVMKQKVAIIGSGIVAQTLGAGFLKYDYEVMLGTRDSSKLTHWRVDHSAGLVGSFSDAAAFGDLLVLAVAGRAAKSALEMIDPIHLTDKTIIDVTNPIADTPPVNGVLRFFTDLSQSLLEKLQHFFPQAHFVKAFNSVGSALMVNPPFESKPTMFICGNQEAAKTEVQEIVDLFGWEGFDMGTAESARAIEPLCMLWCIPGLRDNQWGHAFKLLKI